ncbi:MAG: hypothetical protein AAFP90_13175, partial [Planctomycetota bacterium]
MPDNNDIDETEGNPTSSEQPDSSTDGLKNPEDMEEDEGPGWLPAIMAIAGLLGIAFFVCCGVSTWVLWTKRGELAIRTLDNTYQPLIQQSRLSPEDKSSVSQQLQDFSKQIAGGKVEDWQAAGVMQRLARLPLMEWGDLAAIEAM